MGVNAEPLRLIGGERAAGCYQVARPWVSRSSLTVKGALVRRWAADTGRNQKSVSPGQPPPLTSRSTHDAPSASVAGVRGSRDMPLGSAFTGCEHDGGDIYCGARPRQCDKLYVSLIILIVIEIIRCDLV